jgi:pimeloyl-ACP methyl ester carboxylesterase
MTGWMLALLIGSALVMCPVFFQSRFIYFPFRYSRDQLQRARSISAQEIRFLTSQGNQAAFFWRIEHSTEAPRNLWLVFGGNGDLALAWLDLVGAFPSSPRTGYLLIDYPGYGICQGKPSPRTILENSEGALQALLEQKGWNIEAIDLSVLGHSLGGAAALQFAARQPVHKIVVVSTFTSMDDMVRTQIGFSTGPLLHHRFDNITSLKTILSQDRVPEIRIFHGQRDTIVPLRMGAALAQLDSSRIKFVTIPGVGHNDILESALPMILERIGEIW